MLFDNGKYWHQIKDGDYRGRKLFDKHYSRYFYKDGRKPKLFVGPGKKVLLLTENGDALFVWRKFISGDGQQGINCAIFRNESKILSSELLKEAEEIAVMKFGHCRVYTYINPQKIKSQNPGYCFKVNGWKKIGITKVNKLHILEKNL